jgi:hypothetical protein
VIAFGFISSTSAAPLASTTSSLATLLLLYVGPDQMLPLTSALAAMVGVLLMFWQRLVGWTREAWHRLALRLRRNPKGEP